MFYVFIALFTLNIFPGCSDNSKSTSQNKISITDMTGRTVMIPQSKYIKNIAVPSVPEVLAVYAAGSRDKLCSVTSAAKEWYIVNMFDPHLKKIPGIQSQAGQIIADTLIKTEPDIVIGSGIEMEQLEKTSGLTLLKINNSSANGSIKHIRDEIRFFGSVLGKEDKAEFYVSYLDNILSLIKFSLADISEEKRPRVFMGFKSDHLSTYGSGSFMDEWIKAAGCLNAAGSISGTAGKEGDLIPASMEQLLSWDPDIIVIDSGNAENLFKDPSWSKLKAAQNKKIYFLPSGVTAWNKESCESAAMLPQWLAVTAYPEKLSFIDINEQVKGFYSKIFAFQLTDNMVHNILNPSSDQK
jgi:iron complex transport system substrate-binding protein